MKFYNHRLTAIITVLIPAGLPVCGMDTAGTPHIGWDYLHTAVYKKTNHGSYRLNNAGIQFGVTLPINLPVLNTVTGQA